MARLTRSDLGDLNLFRATALAGGFRRAAIGLDVSPSALSHAVRGLEARLGVRLLNRTTRSITLTQAGRELLAQLEASFGALEQGLEDLNRYRERPSGQLRINVLTDAARLLLGPALPGFVEAYPEIDLDIVVQDDFIDIVADGFDAGIRFGGRVPDDMIAVPIGTDLRWITVASPAYLARHPAPDHPSDLAQHRCIGMRMGTGAIYRWELERGTETVQLAADWSILVSEAALAIDLAEAGGGIAYCLERRVRRQIASGALQEVLPDWSSLGPAFQIYYPGRRQLPHALRALIDHLKSWRE